MNLTATITNNGTLFNGQIFLFVDGNLTCGRHFDIDAGATENIDFSFIPDSEGPKTVTLCTRSWNGNSYDYNAFISGSVTVEGATPSKLTMYPTLKNAEDLGYDRWLLKEDKMVVNINVTNTGSTEYNNVVAVDLFKLYDETHGSHVNTYFKDLQLTAGATTDVEMPIEGMEDGVKYFFYVYYVSAGEWIRGYQYSPLVTVQLEGEDPKVEKFTVQSIDVAGTQKTNEDLTITVNVKNEGNVQTGKLYLFVNNTLAKTFEVDITAGETKAYEATYKPTQAGDITIKVTTDEAGETLAGAEAASTKTVTITDPEPEKVDPNLAIQANEHYISELGYFTATLGQPFNSPALINPHNVAPIVWTSSNPGVATVDENGVVTLLSIGGTQIRADFAGNDDYNPGYAEYYLEVSDTIGYVIEDDGTVTIVGGSDVTGDVVIGETVVIEGKTYQVTGIGDYAFNGNTAITSITIPDGINTIGAGAFDGCSQLTTIIIGKGVTTIGEKAFAHIGIPANGPRRTESEGLLVKCYAENVPTTAADAFEGSPISSGTLLVEDNSVMAYYEATPWGQFGTVMGFNGTTGIERLVNSMGGGSISVFSLNGNKLAETQGAGLKQVLNTLPKGVYIIRVGNNSKAIRN